MKELHHLVEESARRFPKRVAVEDPERDVVITYEDLDKRSDKIARLLTRAGVRRGDRVGIYAPKSIGTVVSVFGILKAGAAYVPVDYTAPPSRNAYIFRNCSVRAMIVELSLLSRLKEEVGDLGTLTVDPLRSCKQFGVEFALVSGWSGPSAVVADLAYILYTSGSTGKPKGVVHGHRSALSFVDWCSDVFRPEPNDRFSSHAPFHFDLSILDIYVPIKHGSTVVLIGENLGKQPKPLAEFISTQQISHWYSTPSILRLIVEYGQMENHDYSALRVVNFAGEVFPLKHLRSLKQLWRHPRYLNLYGPTETNVCTYFELPADIPPDRSEPFPIGIPCSGDDCSVRDEANREVPVGSDGELYVRGGSVMHGYWNMSERTADVFFIDDEGERWYKTGDVVYEDSAGDYIFLGRRDRMVKRRGYRVELGEIESALYRHPSVSEAAVVSVPDEENGVMIKAFVSWVGDSKPSLIKLKGFCADNLPTYMVPDRFTFLTSLPKTSTDKINYQELIERATWTSTSAKTNA